jgi:hypothetical protein
VSNLKSPTTIKRHLRQLRKEVIESDDVMAARIAYAMECAVRWATERTVGWPSLVEQARIDAKCLREALEADKRAAVADEREGEK